MIPPPRLSLSTEDIQALQWVEWTHPKKGLRAYAVNPFNPLQTLHGLNIPPGATPAARDTFRCPISLRKIGEAHFRWRLSQTKDTPDGPWPAKQLPMVGCVIQKHGGLFEVWYRGELIITAKPKDFNPDHGWWVRESEQEFFLWSRETVCARARRRKP